MGTALASGLFAVALLASGQSSTLTGTLAGQVVMEGFVRLRLQPWARRLLTRSVALLPAVVVVALAGHGQGEIDKRLLQLLILSQVVLSFQLPFAIIPLVHFTGDSRRMGEFASRGWLKVLAWVCTIVVVGMNAVYLALQMGRWVGEGGDPWLIYGGVGSVGLALALFLAWVTVYPYRVRREEEPAHVTPPALPGIRYRRIGVGIEFEGGDAAVLAQAAALARANRASLVALHVVEGFGAAYHGAETEAEESRADRARMAELVAHLCADGLHAEGILGYGSPPEELVRLAHQQQLDLLVLGTHGHRLLADLALGRTVSPVLHHLTIPVLVVPSQGAPEKPPTEQALEGER
jgi:manganese transport protein